MERVLLSNLFTLFYLIGLVGILLTRTTLAWFSPFLKKKFPILENVDTLINEFQASFGNNSKLYRLDIGCNAYELQRCTWFKNPQIWDLVRSNFVGKLTWGSFNKLWEVEPFVTKITQLLQVVGLIWKVPHFVVPFGHSLATSRQEAFDSLVPMRQILSLGDQVMIEYASTLTY